MQQSNELAVIDIADEYQYITKLILEADDIDTVRMKFNQRFNYTVDHDVFLVEYLSRIPFSVLQELDLTVDKIPIANIVWRLLQFQIMHSRYIQIGDLTGAGKCLQAAKLELEQVKTNPDDDDLTDEQQLELISGLEDAMEIVNQMTEPEKKKPVRKRTTRKKKAVKK